MIYVKRLDKPFNHILLAYHTVISDSFKSKVYATDNFVNSVTNGSIKGLLDNFQNIFGDAFDTRIPKITNIINEGKVNIGNIDIIVTNKYGGYIVEVPICNIIYEYGRLKSA